VREELPEHKSVIGLGVVLWQANVFIHVESHYMFEAALYFSIMIGENLRLLRLT
jgi:hypothetical protein